MKKTFYVIRYRLKNELNYQYAINDTAPEEAVESYLFGPFDSEQEAIEFINQQESA